MTGDGNVSNNKNVYVTSNFKVRQSVDIEYYLFNKDALPKYHILMWCVVCGMQ